MSTKAKNKPNRSRAQQIVFYNLVKDDANILDKIVKWVIMIHYPLYIGTLITSMFDINYAENGYIGPASMIVPMSLTGAIVLEIAYFVILTYITITLAISMKSYKELKQKQAINR